MGTSTIHTFHLEIAKEIGLDESIIIQQIHYWITKCGKWINNTLWIYNSFNEWHKQFPYWSLSKIKRIFAFLEKIGLIVSKKINAKKHNHTKWYSIDYLKLQYFFKNINSSYIQPIQNMTNRIAQNKPINNKYTKTNYTKDSSYIGEGSKICHIPIPKKEEDFSELSAQNNFFEPIQNPTISSAHTINSSSIPHAHKDFPCKSNNLSSTVEQKTTATAMVNAWNEVFKYSANPIKAYSNQKLSHKLTNILKTHFHSNIEEWKNYAFKVNSSLFLMGEKQTKNNFRAVFMWLIKEETIETILAGGYGVGDRQLDKDNISGNIEKKKEEIISKAQMKVSEYIKSTIDDTKEKAEFKKYVLNQQYFDDNDPYEMRRFFNRLSGHSLIYDSKNKEVYQSLYESYISKKYFGITSRETKAQLSKVLDRNLPQGYGEMEAMDQFLNKLCSTDIFFGMPSCNKGLLMNTAL